ncbi:MAG TPA: hypothetical protein VKF84_05070 [Candidatus Sulfotelmatobacter sp.]|nr:hypothetical protein [Candidatus Sulfotelmatobacter sp.]
MPRLRKMRRILVLAALLAAFVPLKLAAQDDPNADPNADSNDMPLGDVARSLRKNIPPSQEVIDDDNLSTVMKQAESRRAQGSALKFLMAGDGKGFQVSAPDVTCSLAFTANVKSLLSSQYAQMQLPPDEVLKLEGPATIEGNVLIVAVYNRTDWHVSEVTVALTVVKKKEAAEESSIDTVPYAAAKLRPAVALNPPQLSETGSEKKPDVTVIYRMRAAAAPSATTVFSTPLNLELAPDEEWHWAIVQARGYPPRSYAGTVQRSTQTGTPSTAQPILPAAPTSPEGSPTASLSQNPQ